MANQTLYKPKSKIRLRLGLTPPNPDPKKAAEPSRPPSTHLSPTENHLVSSTSTSASGLSRTDSRSAFTYDSSTPSPSARPEFDTVSYNTISPESVAYLPQQGGGLQAYPSHDHHHEAYGYADHERYDEEAGDEYENSLPTWVRDETEGEEDDRYAHRVDEELRPAMQMVAGTDDVFSITDQQLASRFNFVREIGFGNWGSVWLCKPKHIWGSKWIYHFSEVDEATKMVFRLGRKSAALSAKGKVAVKLVHRCKTACTAARVRALWSEMKIIRSLQHEPHPSIIQFEAFVITPSYAIIIMPRLEKLISVGVPLADAIPYLRQLASAVSYLHERGITHNDIKPANVMLSYNNIPVLVDFGFAQQWDLNARDSFLTSSCMGTPEYLDPQRARSQPHDERASDVWALGITMFEILNGRTPFEIDGEEPFDTPEGLEEYYARTRTGKWLGEWDMPPALESLLLHMIWPDPAYRISALQAYHHPALRSPAPSVLITPQFVRAAATYDEPTEPVPMPSEYTQAVSAMQAAAAAQSQALIHAQAQAQAHVQAQIYAQAQAHAEAHLTTHGHAPAGAKVEATAGAGEKKHRKHKKSHKRDLTSHRATTPALGESIKQHTSVSKPRKAKGGEDKENEDVDEKARSLNKLVIKRRETEERANVDAEDDLTPTKVLKPAQPLRIKELSFVADKKVVPRTSISQLTNLSRPNSAASNGTATGAVLSHSTSTSTLKDKRVSVLSSGSAPKTKEEAMLKTMRSLEGTRKLVHVNSHANLQAHAKATEALAAVKRAAPEPPRPKSLDSAVVLTENPKKNERRSLGIDRVLVDVREEEIDIRVTEGNKEVDTVIHLHGHATQVQTHAQPMSPPRAQRSSARREPTPSPQKYRRGRKPQEQMDELRNHGLSASDDAALPELQSKRLVPEHPAPRRASGDMETLISRASNESEASERTHHIVPPQTVVPATSSEKRGSTSTLGPEPSPSLDDTATVTLGAIPRTKSLEALAMDNHLDKMSAWIKSVEHIIEDARKAIAEGREPPLPVLTLPQEVSGDAQEHRFGVTPNKATAIPSHLRTSSTQVEPSTPPKWMTMEEAEERIKVANKWMEEQGKKGKKERPTVSHVLKLFNSEKGATGPSSRSNTPEPGHLVPLKPPASSAAPAHALRGAPSTPALRSSTTRGLTRVPQRKSESNLRNFNTMPVIPSPSFVAGPEYDPLDDADGDDAYSALGVGSPRRVRYENLLSTQPGVIRQGDGWSSLSSGKGMMKPTSMASLRERARALLGDGKPEKERQITDLSKVTSHGHGHKLEKRSSRLTLAEKDREAHPARPGTPAAQSVLTMRTVEREGKKGWLKSLKGAMGRGKKGMDKVEEA